MAFEKKHPEDRGLEVRLLITGKAREIVTRKIGEMQALGVKVFGKERAINVLLAEYYDLKYKK